MEAHQGLPRGLSEQVGNIGDDQCLIERPDRRVISWEEAEGGVGSEGSTGVVETVE